MTSLGLFTDKDVENLNKLKEIIKEIKELDSNFSISNILNINEESILIITTKQNYCKHNINFIEEDLQRRIGVRCVLTSKGTKVEKAINIKKRDNKQEKDYETITFYDERGNIIKEESTYYK